ncbi:MAG TPA: ferrous iron transport protein A [Planctomycetaceae bacterium]|nr:ferrous iron transport protein A [Planctomycetaceae bacterium]HRF02929.1 ferrous iron transport protein A [Pirellulaceae bacterium]
MSRSLADLVPGESGLILTIAGDDAIATRILEMGLTPGARVAFVRTAPLGDPLEVEVRGYRLSLRRQDATRVLLDASSGTPPSASGKSNASP